MFGELSPSQIEEVLKEQVIGRIGCHSEDMTYIVPISYAYDGQFVYCLTKEGMKTDMMRKNRDICFEVDTMENMGNWKSVISWGHFKELTDAEDRQSALEILHRRVLPIVSSATTILSAEWPFTPVDTKIITGVVFRIQLFKKTGRFENNTVPSFLAWG